MACSELAVAAEDLASENVGLTTELVQLRTDKQTSSKAITELQVQCSSFRLVPLESLTSGSRSVGTLPAMLGRKGGFYEYLVTCLGALHVHLESSHMGA